MAFNVWIKSGCDLSSVEQAKVIEGNREMNWSQAETLSGLKGTYNYYAFLGESSDQVLAYVAYQEIFDDLSIHTVWVDPSYRRQGLGKTLFRSWLKTLPTGSRVTLEVREANQAAIRLYQALDFQVIDRRPNYYQQPEDHALIMQIELSERRSL